MCCSRLLRQAPLWQEARATKVSLAVRATAAAAAVATPVTKDNPDTKAVTRFSPGWSGRRYMTAPAMSGHRRRAPSAETTAHFTLYAQPSLGGQLTRSASIGRSTRRDLNERDDSDARRLEDQRREEPADDHPERQ